MPNAVVPFPLFMVIWAAYGLLGLPLLFGRNLALKRRFLRPHIVGGAVLFLVGMALTGFPPGMILLAAPLVGLVTWLNLRQVHFCPQCGATIWRQVPFQRPRFCARCGAAVQMKAAPPAA